MNFYCRGWSGDADAVVRRGVHGRRRAGRGWRGRGIKKGPRGGFSVGTEGGGDLLSRFRSTIGAARLNFSVRDGKRWGPRAVAAFVVRSVRP